MLPPTNELDPVEARLLQEIAHVCDTISTAGWQRIWAKMEEFVQDAHDDMVGNLSSDPNTYMRLQLRWQQREAMKRGIEQYISEIKAQRQMILDEVESRRKFRESTEYGVPIEVGDNAQ